ncbi:MAG: phosphoglycerate dehydrogenase [Alphaproteobacteria bacterium]|nr:phosphoglycerate dehydrogenase [Alphaproteobacteria bacterium]MDE2336803.1 phosphoglycerate dehydrogenase [Alphaproteobacteria bacterium]
MTTKPKVLISDKMSPEAEKIFRDRGVDVTVKTDLKPEELKEMIRNFDGLAIRSATKVTAEILKMAGGSLKVIGRAGIGVDNVDIPAATGAGIVVMNTPYGNSITTAEHTIAMMMTLARQIPSANASTHAGKWEKSKYMGQELFGKTLGVIGCGNIGSIVADRALGLKMKVIAYDPFLSAERAVELGVEKVELEDIFTRSDFITLHTPKTEHTKGIINKFTIGKMKKGVRIINCARGGLVVEADLKAALDSGHVAGAALDVFEEEPAKSNVLFGMENVVCTPHLGASTVEAQENVALQVAEQMADFLLHGAVSNAINMPSVSAEDAPKLRPYMQLAEQLGSFSGQLVQAPPMEIKISFEGNVAALNTKPLTALILAGFLKPSMEGVNIVSAPAKAREMGIALSETRRDKSEAYQTLISVTVVTAAGKNVVAGTVFGEHPRIVDIDGVPVETGVGKNMLYIVNADKPGLIGAVGTLLGDAKINIADFTLGRIPGKNKAVALISIDEKIPEDIVGKITKLPHVERAQALKF